MKKITLLAAVIIAASFASCKKEYTCECTTTINGATYTASGTSGKMKKKDAKTWCENGNDSYTTCKIK